MAFPPSTMVSPGSSSSESAAIVASVASPDGTIDHTALGASSAATSSGSEAAPAAPALAWASTASGLGS